MVHLRTVPDAWHARVLAARLGAEGIVTHLQGNLAGPYPFGAVRVMVEAGQAELAAALLLADEVEAAFATTTAAAPSRSRAGSARGGSGGARPRPARPVPGAPHGDGPEDPGGPVAQLDEPVVDLRPHSRALRWRRALAAAAALLLAGAPLLAHFVV
jgi:hypothetical protein